MIWLLALLVAFTQCAPARTLLVVNATPDTLWLYVADEARDSIGHPVVIRAPRGVVAPAETVCLATDDLHMIRESPYLQVRMPWGFRASPPLIGGLLQGDPTDGTAREVNLVTDHAEWAFYADRNVWGARWEPCR